MGVIHFYKPIAPVSWAKFHDYNIPSHGYSFVQWILMKNQDHCYCQTTTFYSHTTILIPLLRAFPPTLTCWKLANWQFRLCWIPSLLLAVIRLAAGNVCQMDCSRGVTGNQSMPPEYPLITTTAATHVAAVTSKIIAVTSSLSSYYITSLSLSLLVTVIVTIS